MMLHKEENYKGNMLEKTREEGLRIQMEDWLLAGRGEF